MRKWAPAAERNRGPIADVLSQVLPERGLVIELASGSGQHAVHFAERFPTLQWQPTDIGAEALESIEAWRDHAGLPNVRPPVRLDATATDWGFAGEPVVAVLAINMIHIAPWEACEGLVAGARRVLSPGGRLILYGPYCVGGKFHAPSNAEFHESLRSRDPAWGVRDLDDVTALARRNGFDGPRTFDMPANNTTVVFTRRGEEDGDG